MRHMNRSTDFLIKLTGHVVLNKYKSRIDTKISKLCSSCKVLETLEHFLYDCDDITEAKQV